MSERTPAAQLAAVILPSEAHLIDMGCDRREFNCYLAPLIWELA